MVNRDYAYNAAMSPQTIFLGGVHGAGKSTVSRQIAKLLGLSHVTAGGLIKETASDNYRATTGFKAVPDLPANQMLLLSGLTKYRIRNNGPLLLDGHFVLLEPDGKLAEIPFAVYDAIAPVAVMLIEAEPTTVHARLLSRDGQALPVTTIAEFARRERSHAERVCRNLNIPFRAISTDGTVAEAVATATVLVRGILEG